MNDACSKKQEMGNDLDYLITIRDHTVKPRKHTNNIGVKKKCLERATRRKFFKTQNSY